MADVWPRRHRRRLTLVSEPNGRLTRTALRALLDEHGLDPSRALGQNFLCEPDLADKIVRLAGVQPGDRVIEIGPGLGSLTLRLAAAGADVTAVEVDRHLVPVLRGVVADHHGGSGTIDIVHGDALTIDWEPIVGDAPHAVVANLPYNIATPLVLDLLRDQPGFGPFLVMVQREVGERLAAVPGNRDCGIPSILVSYWGKAQVVGRVPAEVFLPRPRVESVLVRIDRSSVPNLDVGIDALDPLIRAGFGQRRKMLRRSVASLLTEPEIAGADVDPQARAEQLDLAAWGRLAAQLEEKRRGGGPAAGSEDG